MTLTPPDRRALAVLAALLAAQALFVLAFVVPAHDPQPHDVPVGVVGPPTVAQGLEGRAPEALAVRRYPSEAAARSAIADREVYGAVVIGERGESLLVASAASPAIAQLLEATVTAAAEQPIPVEDVRPLDPEDSRGTTINAMFLPLVVVCLPAALLLGALRLSARGLLGALALFAALGGLLVVALVAGVLGALPGSFLALAGVTALVILAIALPTAGLERLLGPPGIGLAALVFFLVGNPGSGNASAPELLPGFWRAVGPLLPSGAGGSAVRNTAYFDGAAVLEPLLVLGGWALVGAALVLLARPRRAAGRAEPAAAPAGAPLQRAV